MKKLTPLFLFLLMQGHLFSEIPKEGWARLEASPIKFYQADFKEADLNTIFTWITTESRKLDPAGKGFVVTFLQEELSDEELKRILKDQKFSLDLRRVPISDLVRVISSLSGYPFVIQDDTIVFMRLHGPK